MPRPEQFPHKKLIGFDDKLVSGIDAYRRDQDPIPNFSEAIRQVLTDWLREKGYLPND